jgi:hypothetical protein
MYANDTMGLEDEITVTINVVFTNDVPVVDAQNDTIQMEKGDPMVIKWDTDDADGNYHKYVITMNGTIIEEGDWTGGEITLDLDELDLDVGTYVFVLRCNDTLGAFDSDTITVTVIEAEKTWWEILLENIIAFIMMIIAFFTGLCGLGIYLKRKKNKRDACPCVGEEKCWCSI